MLSFIGFVPNQRDIHFQRNKVKKKKEKSNSLILRSKLIEVHICVPQVWREYLKPNIKRKICFLWTRLQILFIRKYEHKVIAVSGNIPKTVISKTLYLHFFLKNRFFCCCYFSSLTRMIFWKATAFHEKTLGFSGYVLKNYSVFVSLKWKTFLITFKLYFFVYSYELSIIYKDVKGLFTYKVYS